VKITYLLDGFNGYCLKTVRKGI